MADADSSHSDAGVVRHEVVAGWGGFWEQIIVEAFAGDDGEGDRCAEEEGLSFCCDGDWQVFFERGWVE